MCILYFKFVFIFLSFSSFHVYMYMMCVLDDEAHLVFTWVIGSNPTLPVCSAGAMFPDLSFCPLPTCILKIMLS